jgi:hypothetical protein
MLLEGMRVASTYILKLRLPLSEGCGVCLSVALVHLYVNVSVARMYLGHAEV